ncbi:hypothetical protein CROQUDRAFT_471016 [Cronartium quercuum f. sp. fusiforme G11]|uniref:Uncharacterized protein n=1 Tax=Cronartium quercuum f. sp. fusiforme G11 TaxID=708437 RepID=A0A9P6N5Q7_9BASI|nr:hypothetical protein CROQUDRAFT_471016 [Cronartium quercuum f. sp. fusiforme G11]
MNHHLVHNSFAPQIRSVLSHWRLRAIFQLSLSALSSSHSTRMWLVLVFSSYLLYIIHTPTSRFFLLYCHPAPSV